MWCNIHFYWPNKKFFCWFVSCKFITLVDGKRKAVETLEYEAYTSMAIKETQKIINEARTKFINLKNILVYHKLGSCPVGSTSVFIGVSSCHRQDGLQAVAYLIDTLKARVPIWKKEVYSDGTSNWKKNSECHGCNKSIHIFKPCNADSSTISQELMTSNTDMVEKTEI